MSDIPPFITPQFLAEQASKARVVRPLLQIGGSTPVVNLEQLAGQLTGGTPTPVNMPLALPPGSPTTAPLNIIPGMGSPITTPPPAPAASSVIPRAGLPAVPRSNLPALIPEVVSGAKAAGGGGAGVIDDILAGTAGAAAGNKSLLGRLGAAGKVAGKTRFGIAAGAPLLASMIAPQVGGNESALGRFISGAGFGASAGSLSANPLVIGGAAIAGGIANALFGGGDGQDSADDRFNNVISQVPFDDETKSEFQIMYEVLKETSGDDNAALQQVGQAILQRMTQQDTERAAQAKMLATQALTAQFFQPFTQQLLDSAQQRAQIGERLAESLPENYRGIARMQNAASLDNATRTANAYAAQAQLLPALATMQYQQGLASQAAQQAAAQGFGGGAATSLTDLVSQLQAGQTG